MISAVKALFVCALALAASCSPAKENPNEAIAGFRRWAKSDASIGYSISRFESFLRSKDVLGVVPTHQLLRTNPPMNGCTPPPYEIPPKRVWPNIVSTLKVVRDGVLPVAGPVVVVAAYRNPRINRCIRGARYSAHLQFKALDIISVSKVPMTDIVRKLCAFHRVRGPALSMGLGFYTQRKFHVDTKGFRTWGRDWKSKTSPCHIRRRRSA